MKETKGCRSLLCSLGLKQFWCFVLLSAALCCSLLLSAALCCSLLLSSALCCSLLLSAALYCSLLLSVALSAALCCCSLVLSAALCCSLLLSALCCSLWCSLLISALLSLCCYLLLSALLLSYFHVLFYWFFQAEAWYSRAFFLFFRCAFRFPARSGSSRKWLIWAVQKHVFWGWFSFQNWCTPKRCF